MVFWRYILVFFMGFGVLHSDAINSINISSDESTVSFQMVGNFSSDSHNQFYIDVDNDDSTGDTDSWTKGSDYLAEDDNLFRYVDGGWSWTSDLSTPVRSDESITSEVSYSALGIGDNETRTIKVKAADMNASWKNYISFPEEGGMVEVSIGNGENNIGLDDIDVYTDNPRVELEFGDDGNPNLDTSEGDWIGVFEADELAAWNNQVQWAWVGNTEKQADGTRVWDYDISLLDAGVEYKVRYFLNNATDEYVFSSGRFSKPVVVNDPSILTNKDLYTDWQEPITVEYSDLEVGTLYRVHLFLKDKNSAQINSVRSITDLIPETSSGSVTLHLWENIPSGEYEVRLFEGSENDVGGWDELASYPLVIENEVINNVETLKIEGEDAQLSNMTTGDDVRASGGQYIEKIAGVDGEAQFKFYITEAGTYKLKGSFIAIDGESDSFYIKIDDNTEDIWDMSPHSNSWITDYLSGRNLGGDFEYQLDTGEHIITLRGREENVKLDWLELEKLEDIVETIGLDDINVYTDNPRAELIFGEDGNPNLNVNGEGDWIGMFPADAPDLWDDQIIIDWAWVGETDLRVDETRVWTYNYNALQDNTEYIVRYFLNNASEGSYLTSGVFSKPIANNDESNLFQNLNVYKNLEDNSMVVNNSDDNNNNLMYALIDSFTQSIGSLTLEDKTVTPVTGGFDIAFRLKNSTDSIQDLTFKIEIGGIDFTNDDSINILNTQTYMVPKSHEITKGNIVNINPTADDENHISYPRGYSPVIVAHDENFAVGASMLTSYNEEEIALVQFVEHNVNGSWSFIFENTAVDEQNEDGAGVKRFSAKKLNSGESEEFKITVRFADISGNKEENWKYTLAPYKIFFNNRFPNKDIVQRDTRPILGMTFSWSGKSQNDHNKTIEDTLNSDEAIELFRKGYANNGQYFNNEEYANNLGAKLIDESDQYVYKRVMFWAVSGQYHGYDLFAKDECNDVSCIYKTNKTFNLPPQFMTVPDGIINETLKDINSTFSESNIDYGFWWGRAGQTPYTNNPVDGGRVLGDDDWNPKYIKPFDIDDQDHVDFADKELDKAIDYGATSIGLDAFANMSIESQFERIRDMKDRAGEGVDFWQEGLMCDYLHTETSLFLQPNVKWFNKDENADYNSAPILADYLNPNAEIIVWLNTPDRYEGEEDEAYQARLNDYLSQLGNVEIDKLIGLGFTPLLEIKDGDVDNIPQYSGQ